MKVAQNGMKIILVNFCDGSVPSPWVSEPKTTTHIHRLMVTTISARPIGKAGPRAWKQDQSTPERKVLDKPHHLPHVLTDLTLIQSHFVPNRKCSHIAWSVFLFFTLLLAKRKPFFLQSINFLKFINGKCKGQDNSNLVKIMTQTPRFCPDNLCCFKTRGSKDNCAYFIWDGLVKLPNILLVYLLAQSHLRALGMCLVRKIWVNPIELWQVRIRVGRWFWWNIQVTHRKARFCANLICHKRKLLWPKK